MNKTIITTTKITIMALMIIITIQNAAATTIDYTIQVTDSQGNTQTGSYVIGILLANNTNCNNPFYTEITPKTTNNKGVINITINVDEQDIYNNENIYLCYYRDGILKNNKQISYNIQSIKSLNSQKLNGQTSNYYLTLSHQTGTITKAQLGNLTLQDLNNTPGYITDGNTNWNNEYGFYNSETQLTTILDNNYIAIGSQIEYNQINNAPWITDGNTNWNNEYGFYNTTSQVRNAINNSGVNIGGNAATATTATTAGTATTATKANTANTLTINPPNCGAYYYPSGINASGGVESCTLDRTNTTTQVRNAINNSGVNIGGNAATATYATTAGTGLVANALPFNPPNCGAGYHPLGINSTGGVESCTADGAASGDITSVLTSNGDLIGGAQTGDVTLSINTTRNNMTITEKSKMILINDDYTYWSTARANMVGAALSSGTAATYTTIYPKAYGMIYLRDSTTANGGYVVRTDAAILYLQGGEEFQQRFCMPNAANVANTTIIMGFGDSTTAAEPTDGCYLYSFNRKMQGRCKNNAGPTMTSTNITLGTNGCYDARINVDSTSSIRFTVYNMTSKAQLWTSTVTGNIPTTSARATGVEIIAFQSTTSAAADLIYLDKTALTVNQ